MFYNNEMIKNLGYKNKEQFIDGFIAKYGNCVIRLADNGVHANYDWYTSPGMPNIGYYEQEVIV